MDDLPAILGRLTEAERGATPDNILAVIAHLQEAGYNVEVFTLLGKRVYRAIDPETGEHEQVATVPGAVTDWRAVTGVAYLWKVPHA